MSSSQVKRELTEEELFILSLIQEEYGDKYSVDEVFFGDLDEAVLWVDGHDRGFVAVLTNLANMLDEGTIKSIEELKYDWLFFKK